MSELRLKIGYLRSDSLDNGIDILLGDKVSIDHKFWVLFVCFINTMTVFRALATVMKSMLF